MLPTMVAPDEHHHERTEVRLELADDALVAREESRDAARGRRVDREQRARHVDHPAQPPVAGHVDAVVVLRAQVERGEVAIRRTRGQRRIAAHQGRVAKVCPSPGSTGRRSIAPNWLIAPSTGQSQAAGARGRAPRLQRAGEEVVEGRVAAGSGCAASRHVDAVARDEPPDRGLRPALRRARRAKLPASDVSACLGSRYCGKTARKSDTTVPRNRGGEDSTRARLRSPGACRLSMRGHARGFRIESSPGSPGRSFRIPSS